MPECIGLYHPSLGVTIHGKKMRSSAEIIEQIKSLLPCRLFFKPRGGLGGKNACSVFVNIDKKTQTCVASTASAETSFDEFLSQLSKSSNDDYEGWIVQLYIQQHEFLNELNPHTVNTLRIVTFLDSYNEPKIIGSVLRLGREVNEADSWDLGGICVSVDPSSGLLGKGVFKGKHGGHWVSQHPDTGSAFEGGTLPCWGDVVELCKQGAKLCHGVRAIGWDIALTPKGPIVVEANVDWDLVFVQIHSNGGFLNEEFRADLSKFGLKFPRNLSSLPVAAVFMLWRQWRLYFVDRYCYPNSKQGNKTHFKEYLLLRAERDGRNNGLLIFDRLV